MAKFKYKIEEYNEDNYILHIIDQCDSLICPSFDFFKKLYKTKNGWEIKSHRFSEVRCSQKVIYIIGFEEEEYIKSIGLRIFHKSFLEEIQKALNEFSRHMNKDFLKIPESYYEI